MSRRITALNKIGVNSLRNGFYSEAVRSFRHAMECLHQKSTGASSHHDPHQEEIRPQQLQVVTIAIESLDSRMVLECSPHNSFEVYQTAFMFPRVDSSLTFYQVETSIILFYNLGLAHHLSGLSDSNEYQQHSEYHLREALRFYKLALTVFKSTPDPNLEPTCVALILGLLNNLGHVFTHFYSFPEARSCHVHLNEMLESPAILALFEEDEAFFFSAVTCSRQAISAPAA